MDLLRFIQVQSCCYWISLRNGAKIFGFLSLVICIWSFVLTIHQMYKIKTLDPESDHELIFGIYAAALVLQAVSSFLLLLGAYQEKSVFIPWWLVSSPLMVVLDICFIPVMDMYDVGTFETVEWQLVIFDLVLDIYGMLVVFSYYRTLIFNIDNVV